MALTSRLACVLCTNAYALDGDRHACDCGGLLDVVHDWSALRYRGESLRALFAVRRWHLESPADASGVWRFRDLVLPGLAEDELVMRGEGNTRLYAFPRTNRWLGLPGVRFKHEGENPTGSFKDRGMTVAMSWAKRCGAKIVACASTGNTSAAVASYASLAGIPSVILISEKGTALGKVAQSLAYGATTVKIRGDFDQALKLLLAARDRFGLTVMNSVNPVRLEGQKTVMWEAFEQLKWEAPDWVVVPAGNLGNAAAFGKAIAEARELGLITRTPRVVMVQAEGANPLWRAQQDNWKRVTVKADTIATAIKIGAPVNFDKALRTIRATNGLVVQVNDREIMDAKAVLDADGVGAEPASCAAAAGLKKLADTGVIRRHDTALAVLTGHMLKDPDATVGYHAATLPGIPPAHANAPVTIDADLASFEKILAGLGAG